jgi:ATP-dependent exoDNAse (exonuclease V) alpha subunit
MKESHVVHLQYPPHYILVKLDQTKASHLDGLPKNVIPIASVKKSFTINKNQTKVTVTRSQLPLTLAYAFTDYRSQGQTILLVLVDIAPPSYGHLTPFNIYVALSREKVKITFVSYETSITRHYNSIPPNF